MAYDGIPVPLRAEAYARDADRCRWCGATNRGRDLHHIEYRRGHTYDRLDNLITLCRQHHGFVHGTPAPNGATITKAVAQLILKGLVARPGDTGLANWRALKRAWTLEGRCVKHGAKKSECQDCRFEERRFDGAPG